MEPSHNLSVAFESAMKIILQRDSTAAREGMIFEGDRNEIDQYLQAVDEIRHSMELMSTSEDRSKANSVIQIAVARLGDEFLNILTYSTNPRIVETMNSVGHLRLCVQEYRKVRKALMELHIRCLDIEDLRADNVWKLETEALVAKIKRWIRVAKVCARVIFPNEQQLYAQIFHGLGIDIQDAYFMETIKDAAIQLLNFAEAMCTCRRSPERLFSILELHQTMSDLLPDMEVLFQSKVLEAIRIQGAEIVIRLSAATEEILSKFERAVVDELSRCPVPGGSIPSLTTYVMKYIIRISVYKPTLVELLESKPSMNLIYFKDLMIPDLKFMELGDQTPFGLLLIRIIVILQYKLGIKSKEYKDAGLAHLFMLNNVHYIIQRIEGCPKLKNTIGRDYLKQLTGIFVRAVLSYQRSTWQSVFHCLRIYSIHCSSTDLTRRTAVELRERLKTFNALFKKIHQTQAAWSVPNMQLRAELRVIIMQKLIPCYRGFIRRFEQHIPIKYVKYTAEELETAVLDFFEGIA
ncbi:hypothetical protein F0562_006293 [Nyssa sinensis]|uniref:Exocyst subunit Exo70 family protein n=1 Tax=Nyssa sinensis TaxID=561372 RepID=A0A5J5AMQ6_9ASTE|nr:hypothetical protein F0562_006293 [Nyssa sinensis]